MTPAELAAFLRSPRARAIVANAIGNIADIEAVPFGVIADRALKPLAYAIERGLASQPNAKALSEDAQS